PMLRSKQLIQTKDIDLDTLLQNMARMLQRLLGEDITLDTAYASDLPGLEADAGMLEQVIMNLAVNSRHAMPTGGRLRVATSEVEIDSAYAKLNTNARPGRFLCLTVTDTGSGMDRKTLDRIFEPF